MVESISAGSAANRSRTRRLSASDVQRTPRILTGGASQSGPVQRHSRVGKRSVGSGTNPDSDTESDIASRCSGCQSSTGLGAYTDTGLMAPAPTMAPVTVPVPMAAPVTPAPVIPQPEVVSTVVAPSATVDVLSLLMDVVAEKTGYPADALDLSMSLKETWESTPSNGSRFSVRFKRRLQNFQR